MADVVLIQRSECIGNSRRIINDNFTTLESAVNENSITLNTIEGLVESNLTIVSQVSSSFLFLPVNYQTESNANVTLANHTWRGPGFTPAGNQTPFTNTDSNQGWWSGVKTITLTNVPENTVGVLVEIYFEAKSYADNTLKLYVRKDNGENWGAPSAIIEGNIPKIGNLNSLEALNSNYNKISLESTGGINAFFEAENTATFIVYLAGTGNTRTFQYFIADFKEFTPNNFPAYNVKINLQGYYIKIV